MKAILFCFIALTLSHSAAKAQTQEDKDFVADKIKHLTKKVNRGDTAAMADLAEVYLSPYAQGKYYGANFAYDRNAGLALLYTGNEEGSLRCAQQLGKEYESPRYSNFVNIDSSIYYYRIAMHRGSDEALNSLARIYWQTLHDIPSTLYYLKIAAAHGVPDAAKNIETINQGSETSYDDGVAALKAGKTKEGISILSAVVSVKNDGRAAELLGDIYLNGNGVAKNLAEAHQWYYVGAYYHSGACFYKLGNMDYDDQFGDRSYANARQNWDSAAKYDYPGAKEKIKALDDLLLAKQLQKNEAERERQANQLTKADLPGGGRPSNSEMASFNLQQKNNQTTRYTPSSPAFYWGAPKTSAERDEAMYDKMHKESAQREKWYNDKWGR